MNEVSKKELTDALHTIQNVCNYHSNKDDLCKKDCPLLNDKQGCTLLGDASSDWNINTTDKETWKALL